MMLYEEMKSYREEIASTLNEYLEKLGLSPLQSFTASPLEVDKLPLSVAIYIAPASEGSAQYDGERIKFDWELVLVHSLKRSIENADLNVRYFSAIFDYLASRSFGLSSIIEDAELFSMDQGAAVNGSLFLVESTIDASMDYGWH